MSNILLAEGSAASTPASGKVVLYAKTDGNLYSKDDTGIERRMSGGITEVVAPTNFPSANNVDIANIPQTFASLLIVVRGCSFDTATRFLLMFISSDNGSTFSTSGVGGNGIVDTTAFSLAGFAGSMLASGSQTAAQTTTVNITLTGYQSGSMTQCAFAGLYQTTLGFSGNSIYTVDTSATNAIRLAVNSTGNFDAGTYAVYGVN